MYLERRVIPSEKYTSEDGISGGALLVDHPGEWLPQPPPPLHGYLLETIEVYLFCILKTLCSLQEILDILDLWNVVSDPYIKCWKIIRHLINIPQFVLSKQLLDKILQEIVIQPNVSDLQIITKKLLSLPPTILSKIHKDLLVLFNNRLEITAKQLNDKSLQTLSTDWSSKFSSSVFKKSELLTYSDIERAVLSNNYITLMNYITLYGKNILPKVFSIFNANDPVFMTDCLCKQFQEGEYFISVILVTLRLYFSH